MADLSKLNPGILAPQAIRRGAIRPQAPRAAQAFWAAPQRRPSRFWRAVAWASFWGLFLTVLGPLLGCASRDPGASDAPPYDFRPAIAAGALNPCHCDLSQPLTVPETAAPQGGR